MTQKMKTIQRRIIDTHTQTNVKREEAGDIKYVEAKTTHHWNDLV